MSPSITQSEATKYNETDGENSKYLNSFKQGTRYDNQDDDNFFAQSRKMP